MKTMEDHTEVQRNRVQAVEQHLNLLSRIDSVNSAVKGMDDGIQRKIKAIDNMIGCNREECVGKYNALKARVTYIEELDMVKQLYDFRAELEHKIDSLEVEVTTDIRNRDTAVRVELKKMLANITEESRENDLEHSSEITRIDKMCNEFDKFMG